MIVPISLIWHRIDSASRVQRIYLKKIYLPPDPAGATVAWEKSSSTISVIVVVSIYLILAIELIVPIGSENLSKKYIPLLTRPELDIGVMVDI